MTGMRPSALDVFNALAGKRLSDPTIHAFGRKRFGAFGQRFDRGDDPLSVITFAGLQHDTDQPFDGGALVCAQQIAIGCQRRTRGQRQSFGIDTRLAQAAFAHVAFGGGKTFGQHAGDFAVTQEQRGDQETVVAYHLASGRELWVHTDPGHYSTPTGGEGPRATPTLSLGFVYAHGALGRLNCLRLLTGGLVWTRQVIGRDEQVPEWGAASSPLVIDEKVVVHGGEKSHRSLRAFRATDGTPLWESGTHDPSYASASVAVLAGVPQILAFNDRSISGHSQADGAILWEKPWGNGNVVCAAPLIIGPERVLFSSGYGVGSELLELHQTDGGAHLRASTVWKSTRLKSKFAHLFRIGETLYGLDDGIMSAVDLRDGSQRWKEGRYGHGQGLLVGTQYLLMAESGELILMHPTPGGPSVQARLQVFNARTWNPIAAAGPLLLVRNDTEAVCLRLAVEAPPEHAANPP